MSDDDAPYSGAIEETAKAVGKSIDLVRDASGTIADFYGIVIGDRMHAARERRLDEITRKTKKILKDRELSETAEVAEQIAIPLLEAAQREPRAEMQDLWARLLANAMDPNRRDDVRPEFIKTLQAFHPIDAAALDWIGSNSQGWISPTEIITGLNLRKSSVIVSLGNLVSRNCLQTQQGNYAILDFGTEFLLACRL